MKNNIAEPCIVYTAGEDSIFLSKIKDELRDLMGNNVIRFSDVPEDIEMVKKGDAIVYNSENNFAGVIKAKAIRAQIPLVLIDGENREKINFSIEEPIFFAAMDSDARRVAEFLSLIILFNKQLKEKEFESIYEKVELLDEVVADFGNTLNSKLCTIIGYADFALSEASVEEMQKALQISLEAGLDTAQLLQNMLLSVKAIVRTKKKRRAA